MLPTSKVDTGGYRKDAKTVTSKNERSVEARGADLNALKNLAVYHRDSPPEAIPVVVGTNHHVVIGFDSPGRGEDTHVPSARARLVNEAEQQAVFITQPCTSRLQPTKGVQLGGQSPNFTHWPRTSIKA
ncbi:hypothetical protein ACPXB1_27600 [Micromonospora sp. DT68]|uniref:hypothetical protein n=1 Tax=Micromonospora sp. DT68 TaxID=3416522 RepID=UPI003CFA1C53